MTKITLLTGPSASGKNTISHIYATQYSDQCAVIDVDLVRWMLRKPHVAPWPSDTPASEGRYQHKLGIKHASILARSFVSEGFEVIVCDVIGDELARYYRELLDGEVFRIVLLLPTLEETLRRLNERSKTISEDEAQELYEQQRLLQGYDLKIDNTVLKPIEVAERLSVHL